MCFVQRNAICTKKKEGGNDYIRLAHQLKFEHKINDFATKVPLFRRIL